MRTLMIVAAALAASGTYMANVADKMSSEKAQAKAVAQAKNVNAFAAMQPQSYGPRSVEIARDGRGHFQADARIDGRRVNFMVDTGASVIALNETSAAQIGVRPSRGDYTANVSTANGTIKGARTRLAEVNVGGLIVRDVDAMVLPDEALSENLLGLSFLTKLKRFEFAGQKLVLEQ
ncbi:MAG: TIGR02281 family clan AA aspartic protease [Afipia sp.]|nr:TIGR02281 family clan AA aspartic protease [Afipia sp.]